MDAWSRLETAIQYASQDILQIDGDTAAVIWAAIPTFQSIKVLQGAAKLKFTTDGAKRAAKLCEQLVRRNIRRNYIVHGTWRHRVTFNFGTDGWETGEWRREYDHIDPDFPSEDDGSSITIPELDKTTAHVEEMVRALWALVDDIPSLRFTQPPHAQ